MWTPANKASASGEATSVLMVYLFFFQAEDGIRDYKVTGVQTCALPIYLLTAAGVPVFGPSAAAAQIESSKIFAKQLMDQAGIPCALAHTFDDPVVAVRFRSEERRVGKEGRSRWSPYH